MNLGTHKKTACNHDRNQFLVKRQIATPADTYETRFKLFFFFYSSRSFFTSIINMQICQNAVRACEIVGVQREEAWLSQKQLIQNRYKWVIGHETTYKSLFIYGAKRLVGQILSFASNYTHFFFSQRLTIAIPSARRLNGKTCVVFFVSKTELCYNKKKTLKLGIDFKVDNENSV